MANSAWTIVGIQAAWVLGILIFAIVLALRGSRRPLREPARASLDSMRDDRLTSHTLDGDL